MTRLAFYAPMKPPDHPVPSGDREMARNLIAALRGTADTVDTVSTLRLYDGAGDATAQSGLADRARDEVARLKLRLAPDRPDAWITYHNYYKAPDLIGPAVCRALNIPYIQIESTRARRRLIGPWAGFAAAAEAASDAADVIFYLTEQDRGALARDLPQHQRLIHLRPFLPTATLPPAASLAPDAPILAAGMMRRGDKLASYRIIAETLPHLTAPGWHLDIAGDGPARGEVEKLMAPFGGHVRFLGQLDVAGMARAYARSKLLFWPGVNEAFGMVYLEAQAAGLPIVAQDRPGVRDVLAPGPHTDPAGGALALAGCIDALLGDIAARQRQGAANRAHVLDRHLLNAATRTLAAGIAEIAGATP